MSLPEQMSPPATRLGSPWRRASVTLGLALVALVIIFRGTAGAIVALWARDPLAHGYVVVPGVLYLIWERRHRLAPLRPAPALLAFPVIATLAFIWLLGNLSDTRIVQQLCFIAMLAGLCWAILGSEATRRLLFPLGLLLFALPLGDRLVPALQDLAARFSVRLLELSRVPVLLQGHVISIPAGSWRVAEACSGINYLTASLAVGYLYAGTAYRRWPHRVGFFAGAAVAPLVANGLRVYGTILIAHLAGSESIAGTRHYLFGWIVFAVMMALLFGICGHWRERPADTEPNTPGEGGNARTVSEWTFIAAATLGVCLAALAPISARLLALPTGASTVQIGTPEVSPPWRETAQSAYGWQPHFAAPAREFTRTYISGERVVTLYVASYSGEHGDTKLAGVANELFPAPWLVTGRERRAVTFGGRTFQVRESHVEGSSSSALVVWNWYRVGETFTDRDYLAQLFLAHGRLLRRHSNSAAIAVATAATPGDRSELTLRDFLGHVSLTPVASIPATASSAWTDPALLPALSTAHFPLD